MISGMGLILHGKYLQLRAATIVFRALIMVSFQAIKAALICPVKRQKT
jgi:hypothetical protein